MKSINMEGNEVFPSKIICIGRNYVDHIKELGNEIPEEPVIFIREDWASRAAYDPTSRNPNRWWNDGRGL